MPLLKINDVTKTFALADGSGRRHLAIEKVSFSLDRGEIVALIGPSGCGKTTLLRIVAGLIQADSGVCTLDGKTITGPSSEVAMVFQLFSLLPWRTAVANVEFPLELRRVAPEERRRRSAKYLDLVGLTGFEKHRPYQLSGGMQQRVGLARALSVEPQLLVMDEPFGSLDQQTAERLRDELLRIQDTVGTTVLFVTHNIDEAIYLGNRVVLLGGSPSHVAHEYRVDFPKRRWEINVHAEPAFAELRQELRSALLGDRDMAPADAA